MIRQLLLESARSLGRAIFKAGCAKRWIEFRGRATRIILYHSCQHSESNFIRGLGSNVKPEHFEAHLSLLQAHYKVIPLADITGPDTPANAVCITFDDGYESVYSEAYPRLRLYRMPATTFLVTDVVNNNSLVWVNELNWFLSEHPRITAAALDAACGAEGARAGPDLVASAVAHLPAPRVLSLLGELRRELNVDSIELSQSERAYVTWEEVRAMADDGMTFGNHSASHANLQLLSDDDAQLEVLRAHEVLSAEIGSVNSFAFPFGAISEAARDTAHSLGYETVLEVAPRPGARGFRALSRVVAPDAGAADLFAELEFVHPIKTFLRRLSKA